MCRTESRAPAMTQRGALPCADCATMQATPLREADGVPESTSGVLGADGA